MKTEIDKLNTLIIDMPTCEYCDKLHPSHHCALKDLPWRVGRSLGRTLYKNDEFIGAVDTCELAEEIVNALNEKYLKQLIITKPNV